MKSNIITSFAAGVLLATSVSGIVYFSTNDGSTKVEATANDNKQSDTVGEAAANTPTVEEMKDLLTSSGYVVQSAEEAKNAESATEEKSDDSKESEEVKEEEKKDEVKTITITVSSGMTSYDVGETLNNEKIIKESALEFSQKVDKKGVAEYLKLGSFKISSDMSTDKIISTIFKKQS